jgi:Zn2+/Cd2+-exporting ATPase
MTEKTVEIEIPILLPGVEDDGDGCLMRLEKALQDQKGLQRAHLEHGRQPAALCLHYDPEVISLAEVQRMAERAGAGIANRYQHNIITVEGMDCSDCARVIEHSVGRMEGVLSVNVNYAAQLMRVEFDRQKIERNTIEKRLRSLGYTLPANGLQGWFVEHRELLFSLSTGLLLLVGWIGGKLGIFPLALSNAFYVIAYILGGWDIAQHAWHAVRERRFDTDLLMVVAAMGAALLGELAEGALLLFLFSLGHALENRALERARRAVRALADLVPKTARVVRGDIETDVPVEQVVLDDLVIILPGVRISVDGMVTAGHSGVDQSPVTGESIPLDKAPGDKVFAGTINGEGALEVRATRLAKDSTLAHVMAMVEEAQTQKSSTQLMAEKFEQVYVPVVLVIVTLLVLVPPLFGVAWQASFLRAMTLLVAASPCALALGTPSAVLAGVAQAARNGVLVKGGAHLENLGTLKAIAFDKTGTITNGKLDVVEILDFRLQIGDSSEILSLVASVEGRSGHPLAQAVVRAAHSKTLPLLGVGEVHSLNGRGLRSSLDGKPLLVGSLSLMEEHGVIVPEQPRREIDRFQAEGKTIVLAALDGQLVGALALADTLRPDVPPALSALRELGIRHTVMLTGDTPQVAAAIARQAGLTDFRASLLPEDKLRAIEALSAQYGAVGMVGDGVNDAPALAHATVGIAMGGAGTDVALETADVALMGSDLSRLPFAIGLGRAARGIILQNLVIAMGVIILLGLAALTGRAGIGAAVIIHECSTLVVVLNALRLLQFRN